MTMELLEEVCKRLEGLNADMWSADNYENPKSYGVLLGDYHENLMRGFDVAIEKENRTWAWGTPDNYYMKIKHINSLNEITFGGSYRKTEEGIIRSLFSNVDAKVKAYRKDLLESEEKTKILTGLLKELKEP